MKKRKLITSLLCSIIGITLTSMSVSFAWFVMRRGVDSSKIKGSVIASYFHAGTGDENDPFIISVPKHFENLVWLHTNVDGFYKAECKDASGNTHYGYYFEIGCPTDRLLDPTIAYNPSSTAQKYVFDFNGPGGTSTGSTNTSKILNLESLKNLIPIGTSDLPFMGTLKGNYCSVKGFTVNAFADVNNNGTKDEGEKAFSDIGVFGYVSATGTCKDTYFTDFTINCSGCDSAAAVTSEHDAAMQAAGTHDENTCNIGYIAGHICDAATFTNVYCNRNTMTGPSGTNIVKSLYGFYGKADKMAGDDPGGKGKGFNYNIDFDSSAFYQYFNDNWSTGKNVNSMYVKARNTEYDSTYYPNRSVTIDGEAMYSKTGYIGGWLKPNYVVKGTTPGDGGTSRNFSMSTLGYVNPGSITSYEDTQFDIWKTKSGVSISKIRGSDWKTLYAEGSLMDIPSDTQVTTTPWNKSYLQSGQTEGHYLYYDVNHTAAVNPTQSSAAWIYYTTKNTRNSAYNFTVKTDASKVSYKYTTTNNVAHFNSAHLWVSIDDDEPYDAGGLTLNDRYSSKSGTTYTRYIDVTPPSSIALSLTDGTHYIALKIELVSSYPSVVKNYFRYPKEQSSYKSSTLTMDPVKVSVLTSGKGTSTYTFNGGMQTQSSYTINKKAASKAPIVLSGTEAEHVFNVAAHKVVEPESGVKWLWLNNLPYQSGNPQLYSFVYNASTVSGEPSYWIATKRESVEIGRQEAFIADEDIIVDSGYNYKNLDIVGGGVTFQPYYVCLVAEQYNLSNLVTQAVPNSSVGNGTKFYATKYCPNSIVLYMKNMHNSDGTMGTFTFEYSVAVGQLIGWTAKEPCFKKGKDSAYTLENSFVDFTSFGSDYTEIESGTDRSCSLIVRTSTIKKASYCALDSAGGIVAKFDAAGNLVAGSTKNIDTYVLCMGAHKTSSGSINFNTRISSISMEFKAEGYGGSFGTVDYRDETNALPVVTTTILSFVVTTDPGAEFTVLVSYATTETNKGTYTITASGTTGAVKYVFYFYNMDAYTFIINGVTMTDASYPLIC